MEVFAEVLEPFVEVATLEPDIKHVHSFDIDFPIKKHFRRLLIVSKLSTCINIMHSFSAPYCMPHIFLSLYLQNVVPTKEIPFI
jgi:hypothetical protein